MPASLRRLLDALGRVTWKAGIWSTWEHRQESSGEHIVSIRIRPDGVEVEPERVAYAGPRLHATFPFPADFSGKKGDEEP